MPAREKEPDRASFNGNLACAAHRGGIVQYTFRSDSNSVYVVTDCLLCFKIIPIPEERFNQSYRQEGDVGR